MFIRTELLIITPSFMAVTSGIVVASAETSTMSPGRMRASLPGLVSREEVTFPSRVMTFTRPLTLKSARFLPSSWT